MFRKSLLLCAFLCMFFSMSIHFLYADEPITTISTNYDDSIMVIGFSIEFVGTSTGDITLWEWDFENDQIVDAYGSTVVHSFEEEGDYTVKLTVWEGTNSFSVFKTCSVASWSLQLKSVGFRADSGDWHVIYRDETTHEHYSNKPNEPYSLNPQWQDNSNPLNGNVTDVGDKRFPISYTSGSKMEVQVCVVGKGDVPTPISIRGTQTEGYSFGGTSGIEIDYTSYGDLGLGASILDCDKIFEASKIQHWDDLAIEWEANANGSGWMGIGTSDNEVCVTLATPTITNLYHTTVHIACKYGKNETTLNGACDKIYEYFKSQEVKNYKNEVLGYYLNSSKTVAIHSTADLLLYKDGRCSSWANLFHDILCTHGCSEQTRYSLLPNDKTINDVDYDGAGLLIKNWTYNGFSVAPTRGDSIDGQNNDNPTSSFDSHQVNKYNNYYYDPSYGTEKLFSTVLWEANSLDIEIVTDVNSTQYFVEESLLTYEVTAEVLAN